MTREVRKAVQHSPFHNQLLAALPLTVYARLLPHLELVALAPHQVIYEPGQVLQYVYFPTTSIAARLQVLHDSSQAVNGLIGFDGMVGITLFMGGESNIDGVVIQGEGHAYRLERSVLQHEFARSVELRDILLLYTQAFMTQMAQTAVCTRLHAMDQQLCRWLLLYLDRSSSNILAMTHALLADTLGVRRESVTDVARHLHAAGLIRYMRGKITVLDRPGLEARACECYAVVKREYARLLLHPETDQPLELAPVALIPTAR